MGRYPQTMTSPRRHPDEESTHYACTVILELVLTGRTLVRPDNPATLAAQVVKSSAILD